MRKEKCKIVWRLGMYNSAVCMTSLLLINPFPSPFHFVGGPWPWKGNKPGTSNRGRKLDDSHKNILYIH
jgi:hypothetical protein